MPNKYRNGKITVAGLIEQLKELPQDKSVLCQLVVEGKAEAWNMFFDVSDVKDSDWLVQLRVYHPEFTEFPDPTNK